MATIVIKNLTSEEMYLRDLRTTIGKAGSVDSAVARMETITVTRPLSDIEKWDGIAKEIDEGTLVMSVVLSEAEVADLDVLASTSEMK